MYRNIKINNISNVDTLEILDPCNSFQSETISLAGTLMNMVKQYVCSNIYYNASTLKIQ